MAAAVLLALLNGLLIGASRAVNGHLGRKVGVIRASLWNHGVGFGFLSVLVVADHGRGLPILGAGAGAVPMHAWMGGVLGVAFVAMNSHVVVRLGASRTVGLVVGAQMLASILIETATMHDAGATFVDLGGAALIVLGIRLSPR